jgi:hypothetical protein
MFQNREKLTGLWAFSHNKSPAKKSSLIYFKKPKTFEGKGKLKKENKLDQQKV